MRRIGLGFIERRTRLVRLAVQENAILHRQADQRGAGVDYIEESSPAIELAKVQLNEYFEGKRKVFDVSLRFIGTDFQESVWEQLQKVAFGQTATY